jgi:uroporphyrin-III C-methyltransferase
VLALATRAERVAVGKRCGRHSTAQRFINKRLADAARTHRVVVRLKGGDPLLFGRAKEEIAYLQSQGIRVEVVPGVTAALAASASLATSLTERGVARSVAFVTPRAGTGEPPSRWLAAAMAADTVAIYMGAHDAPDIVSALAEAGKSLATPVAVLEGVSLERERVAFGTLAELPELVRGAGGPVVILLGEVYREQAKRAVIPAKAGTPFR